MTCPSCGGELVPGAECCPVCAASVAPRVEGALAADPRLVTPPARGMGRAEPIREIPALRRPSRERTWRDEVQERVRSRRQKRADSGLPLFDGLEEPAVAPNAAPPAPAPEAQAAPVEPAPVVEASSLASASAPVELGESVAAFPEKTWELASAADARVAPADDVLDTLDRAIATRRRATPSLERPMPSLDVDGFADEGAAESEVELSAPAAESSPVERPARPFERVQAAAVDLALFSLIAMVVVYFAGRAARVDLEALSASWRWLAAYLGLLAVFYASYFTGTTGQTPGKLVTGLRVVGATGRPPHYPRAAARAVAGFAGILVAGLGCVPMAFDPAARALHDRLFRTRVVRG